MYVAKRAFHELLTAERVYEGDELRVSRHSTRRVDHRLHGASTDHPAYAQGLRWQLELDAAKRTYDIIAICAPNDLHHQVIIERGRERVSRRIVAVDPQQVTTWLKDANEAETATH